jgi:protein-S-isoprenylcysteine O-methyltransferase Ste14
MMSDRARGRLLVSAQFLLIGVIAISPGDRLWPSSGWLVLFEVILLLAGGAILALAFAHLGPALTANPVPKAGAPLQTSGIYAFVRHPIYTGVLVSGLGVALYRTSMISFIAYGSLVLLLNFKARWEEVFLKTKHSGYLTYMVHVPRFVPRRKRDRHAD